MKYELHSQIEIDASPDVVWKVLTDLERYHDWNPFIVSSRGELRQGETLVNRMQPPGGRAMTFKPKVTEVDDGAVFEWLGHLGVPGLFDGRHRFELQAAGNGTLLRQDEYFSGVLVRLMRKNLDGGTTEGFHAMNRALKERAESL
ncbi:MAG: SRPBCC domain-containing protein [Actinobacteria bacterium]|nr:SRPBCC domain-containing protein [Actinomycetota bacterium]